MSKRIFAAIFSIAFVLSFTLAHAQSSAPVADTAVPAQAKTASHPHTPVQQNPGDRVFQANCARCHSAPEAFSPRITGTIVMHMRVRANLSARDQQFLVKYLAP
jgi:cytochrome c5